MLVELGEIGDDVFDDIGVWKRVDLGLFGGISWNAAYLHISLASLFSISCCVDNEKWMESGKHTQTSQRINSINIHGTASTDTLPTTPSKRERRVNLILDSDQRIQHHGSGLVEVQSVLLHARLVRGRVWVPTVDAECLDLGLRFSGGGHGAEWHIVAEYRARRCEQPRCGGAEGSHSGRLLF